MTVTELPVGECAIAPAGDSGTDNQVTPGTDEEFMRVLYERYRPQLQGYVVRLTRDVQWAEDIVQAALVRGWRARDQLTMGEAATRSWLFTAAHNVFIDEYRSRCARPVTLTERDIVAPGSVADEAERLAWSLTLVTALSELSESQREAIVYVYYLRRTIDETAATLGISPGTVKSRLYYGVRALRNRLTPALREASRLPGRASTA